MRRVASYARAIDWMIDNDDTEWLDDEYGSISVTAALAADLFGRTNDEITADLRRAKKRAAKNAA